MAVQRRWGMEPAVPQPDKGVTLMAAQQPMSTHGMVGAIGREEIDEALATLQKYKQGKANLEQRVIDNEQWWKMQHWAQIRQQSKNPGDPEPVSGWLFNSLANKHADAMDNYPAPNVLPREQADEQDAKILSEILPVVLEQNDYERLYSEMWWYKLKTGTGVTGVFWDSTKNNGLGDIDIRPLDLLNLFWQPGITDVQKSRNLFHVELVDSDLLKEQYPDLKDPGTDTAVEVAKYIYDDTVDTTDKSVVVDWYYKIQQDNRTVVHYCKFCNGNVLYASQNDPAYADRGYYDHGKYPVVFDVLFPEAGTPAGFGYIDVCKEAQIYIDKLDQVILKHAVMGSRPRFFVKGDGAINENEFADWTKDFVHYSGNGNPNESISPIEIPVVSPTYVDVRQLKIDELKETSGNRDFSQGGTSGGVTSGTAIAQLAEAGNKLSRDMIKSAYRAFRDINYLVIDLMRQFYEENRYFRIIGERGEMEFVQFTGRQIAEKMVDPAYGAEAGFRIPIFDVVVTAQKSSPFSTVVQNDRAMQLYAAGFFNPEMADQSLAALDMMEFDGIEKVRDKIAQNGTLFQQVQLLQQQLAQLATIVDAQNGTSILANMAGAFTGQQPQNAPAGAQKVSAGGTASSDTLPKNSQAAKAKNKAAQATSPK